MVANSDNASGATKLLSPRTLARLLAILLARLPDQATPLDTWPLVCYASPMTWIPATPVATTGDTRTKTGHIIDTIPPRTIPPDAVTHLTIELVEGQYGDFSYSIVDENSPQRHTLVEGFPTFRNALLYLYELYKEFPEVIPQYIDYNKDYGA